jgi:hypothetical protein
MHVKGFLSHGPQGIHDKRAYRDVWYEATVHDVDVHPVTSCLVNCFDLHHGEAVAMLDLGLVISTSWQLVCGSKLGPVEDPGSPT